MAIENVVLRVKESVPAATIYYFDLFKGESDENDKVRKIRSVGLAMHIDGQKTFRVSLKTFLKDDFYLLPEARTPGIDFHILTRMPSCTVNKKFLWHTVGTGTILNSQNAGLMQLKWDLLSSENIYMNLHPRERREGGSLANSESEKLCAS